MNDNATTNSISPEALWVPFTTVSLTGKRVLALAPHPDDETLACGGSLLLHRQQHDAVKIIFLTDGALADTGLVYARENYVQLRETEARQAAALLGTSDIEFWRVPDRSLTATPELVARLVETIVVYQPTLIYAPSPLEFHPDHRATAEIVWQAVRQATGTLATHTLEVAFYEYNRPLSVNTLVDISAVMDAKRAACQAYQSQLASYPYDECAIGLNRYRALTVAPACVYAEGFYALSAAEIRQHSIEHFSWSQFLPAFRLPPSVNPLVSVVVRTKDRPGLLREALASLAAQTYRNLEVIVVNDGGQDVANVLADFEPALTLRCIAHSASKGRAAAANSGLRQATGTFICFLDDDDLLHPRHLQKLAGFLAQTGEQFAYTDCERVEFGWDGTTFFPLAAPSLFLSGAYERERLLTGNFIPIMTAMFTRKLLERAGHCDETLAWLEDWDLWLRMSEQETFHYLPGISAVYRVFAQHDHLYESCYERVRNRYTLTTTTPLETSHSLHRINRLMEENNRACHELARQKTAYDELANALAASEAQLSLLENSQSLKWGRRLVRAVPMWLRRWLRQAS